MSLRLRQALAVGKSLSLRRHFNLQAFSTIPDIKPFNSRISNLMKNGHVEQAQQLFDQMPHRNTVTYNAMIRGYIQNGSYENALYLYNKMPSRDIFSYNTMISGLMRAGDVKGAENVFESMENRDIVTWNSLISGYVENGLVRDALMFFDKMPVKDVISWNSVIAGLVKAGDFDKAEELFKKMDTRDVVSWTILMKAYLGAGRLTEARKVFDDMPVKDIQAWNTMIRGYVDNNFVEIAEGLFHEMPVKDFNSWSVMIDSFVSIGRVKDALILYNEMPHKFEKLWNSILFGLVKNGFVREAHAILEKRPFGGVVSHTNIMVGYFSMGETENAMKVFRFLPARDTTVWNVAIFGLGENDHFEEGVKLFVQMKKDCFALDEATFTSFLTICSNLPSLDLGKQMHAEAIKVGGDSFTPVGNAFITMYFRCGNMESALFQFNSMTRRDIISWNSVICGLAHHGHGEKAVEFFEKMRFADVSPNQITFVGVLSACSHAGLVGKGKHYFNLMWDEYSFERMNEHYTCMVDLLGKYGLIEEAMGLVRQMSLNGLEAHTSVWGALLAACRAHKNIAVAEIACQRILEVEPTNSGIYMILAEMYLASGMREKAYGVWGRMRENGVKKQPGCSWIESGGAGKVFLAGDRTHPDFASVSCVLDSVYRQTSVEIGGLSAVLRDRAIEAV
ncbi:Pentatricopeptide repeat-containing protein [Striga hermonthica]|uniref:Pentatricopeptide repeat-containing protein n=1 Tax=Striga hermonthica TaxID=68872 RepID=A0A9N7MR40_STRHE|nr:Pentatricopeptide repeat-containing protein [Striga hermonthica]